jgi:hypothetical protein
MGMPSTKVAYRSLLADMVQPDAVKELCKLWVIVSGEAAKTCAEEKCLQDDSADYSHPQRMDEQKSEEQKDKGNSLIAQGDNQLHSQFSEILGIMCHLSLL